MKSIKKFISESIFNQELDLNVPENIFKNYIQSYQLNKRQRNASMFMLAFTSIFVLDEDVAFQWKDKMKDPKNRFILKQWLMEIWECGILEPIHGAESWYEWVACGHKNPYTKKSIESLSIDDNRAWKDLKNITQLGALWSAYYDLYESDSIDPDDDSEYYGNDSVYVHCYDFIIDAIDEYMP